MSERAKVCAAAIIRSIRAKTEASPSVAVPWAELQVEIFHAIANTEQLARAELTAERAAHQTCHELVSRLTGQLNQARAALEAVRRENAELRERLATVRRELSGAATRLRCEADDVESIGHMNEAEDIRDYADRLDRISKLAALTPPTDEKAT